MLNKIFIVIEVKNLNKIYSINKKRNSRGLVDVSFVLPSSSFVFIFGKSGSGKSTLINYLGLLDKPTIFLLVFTIILIIFIVSTLIPLLILKKITPSKIVNNKNE